MGPHFYSKWLVLSGETKPVRTNPILKGDENDHHGSGQIRSRPHTGPWAPKKVAVWKGNGTPAISGKSRLVKYYSIWPDGYKLWDDPSLGLVWFAIIFGDF